MTIPPAVKNFITRAIVPGGLTLPYHYPTVETFNGFQSAYRYHGNTLEDLTSTAPGAFQPGWYVVARNYYGDPYIVDFTEEAQGFPVYYAPIGAGQWVATKVADTLVSFTDLLNELAAPADNPTAQADYLRARVDITTEPWQEVYTDLLSNEDSEQ